MTTPTPTPQWVQDPAGNWHAVNVERKTATGAIVCGVLGVVLGLIPLLFLFAWALGACALVLGVSGWRKPAAIRPKLARAAAVLGALAVALGAIGFAIVDNALS